MTDMDEALAHAERLIYESGLRLGEMSRENARLQAHAKSMIDAMRTDNERLRAALEDVANAIRECDEGDPSTKHGWASDELLRVWEQARAALEPKP